MSILNAYTKDGQVINIHEYTDEYKGKLYCILKHPVIAKRGKKMIWHYAHRNKKTGKGCMYSKGPWHIWSQNRIKYKYIEQRITEEGKYHIADVLTPSGIVIEFQNSVMVKKEMRERERFYKQYCEGIVWVFNADRFDFDIIERNGNDIEMVQTYGSTYWQEVGERCFLDQGKQGYLEVWDIGKIIKCRVWTMVEFDNEFLKGIVKDNCDMRKMKFQY